MDTDFGVTGNFNPFSAYSSALKKLSKNRKLDKGVYKVVMNERVDIPENLTGYAFPRSSLLRMGCTIDYAVWDAGYTGTGSFLLTVNNEEGVEIKENARVNQLVFERIDSTEGYSGKYHEE